MAGMVSDDEDWAFTYSDSDDSTTSPTSETDQPAQPGTIPYYFRPINSTEEDSRNFTTKMIDSAQANFIAPSIIHAQRPSKISLNALSDTTEAVQTVNTDPVFDGTLSSSGWNLLPAEIVREILSYLVPTNSCIYPHRCFCRGCQRAITRLGHNFLYCSTRMLKHSFQWYREDRKEHEKGFFGLLTVNKTISTECRTLLYSKNSYGFNYDCNDAIAFSCQIGKNNAKLIKKITLSYDHLMYVVKRFDHRYQLFHFDFLSPFVVLKNFSNVDVLQIRTAMDCYGIQPPPFEFDPSLYENFSGLQCHLLKDLRTRGRFAKGRLYFAWRSQLVTLVAPNIRYTPSRDSVNIDIDAYCIEFEKKWILEYQETRITYRECSFAEEKCEVEVVALKSRKGSKPIYSYFLPKPMVAQAL